MSLMEKLRGSTDSTPMQVVLILIVVAFVGWYALPQGEQVNVALQVDGDRILMSEFGPRYHLAKSMVESQEGDLDDAREAEILNLVKQQMARDVVLAHEAERLGFEVSAEEITRVIKSDPRYFDEEGKFDVALWKDAVKGSGRSRAEHEATIRRELLRDKLRASITLGVAVDERAAREEYDELMATIDVEYLAVDGAMLAASADPAAVRAWAAANPDQVRAAYEQVRASRYELPAQVGLQVIRLSAATGDRDALRARLESVRAQAVAGEDFSALARRWSEDAATVASGGDLGERRLSALTASVRDGVAEVPVGGVSAVLDEGDRLSLYRVTSRQEARTIPFEDVQDEIALGLYADDQAAAIARELAAGWTDVPPVERMLALGVELATLPGVAPARYEAGPGKPPRELVDAAAKAEPGAVLAPLSAPSGDRKAWYVGRLVQKNAVDDAEFPAFVAYMLQMERGRVFERYADDLQTRAVVDTGEGTVTQGGWRDWLSGILPDSSG